MPEDRWRGEPTLRLDGALGPGTRLENYEILSVLGTGGFAYTYKARHTTIGKTVAIKEYMPQAGRRLAEGDVTITTASGQPAYRWGKEWRTRLAEGDAARDTEGFAYRLGLDGFLREARILASIKHPNIVTVDHFIVANGTAYIVMEYVGDSTLRSDLDENGPWTEDRVWNLLDELVKGLQEVHEKELFHLDIKDTAPN